jgi:hypothetical protein
VVLCDLRDFVFLSADLTHDALAEDEVSGVDDVGRPFGTGQAAVGIESRGLRIGSFHSTLAAASGTRACRIRNKKRGYGVLRVW